MCSFNPSPLPIVFFAMVSFLGLAHAADPIKLYTICANTTFTSDGSYLSLVSLLSPLTYYAARNFQFYSVSSPTLPNSSNASSKLQISGHNISIPLHAMHLCRGDVSPEMCLACVANATGELIRECTRKRSGVIWYEECMVRYSDESIFSTVSTKPTIALFNTQNISDQVRFSNLVNTTMAELAGEASNSSVGVKKFGVKEVRFNFFQNLYSLVQCTPDLSSTDCNSCLQAAINRLPWCCDGKQGGRVIFPSCNVRYELYEFYSPSTAPAPAPGLATPPPPRGSETVSKGQSKILTVTILAIVSPIVVSLVPFLLC